MEHIDSIFSNVKESMRAYLPDLGFDLFREKDEGVFGIKYIELHRGTKAIRFGWDGKGTRFILESCEDISLDPYPKWDDIHLERIILNELDSETSEQIMQIFREAISKLVDEYWDT